MEYSLHLILLEYRKKPNSTFKKIKTSSRSQAWYPVPLPSVLPVCFSAPRQTSHWEVVSVQDSPDACRDAVFRLWWEGFGAKIQHFRESTGPCHGWRPRTWSGMLPHSYIIEDDPTSEGFRWNTTKMALHWHVCGLWMQSITTAQEWDGNLTLLLLPLCGITS